MYQKKMYEETRQKNPQLSPKAALKASAKAIKSQGGTMKMGANAKMVKNPNHPFRKAEDTYQELADEANEKRKFCTKSQKTGYVRDPETNRKRKISVLPPMHAARLGVHRKTGADGSLRWLMLVTGSKRVYAGLKRANWQKANYAYWSKKIPPGAKKPCMPPKKIETVAEAQRRKKEKGLKRAVRRCVAVPEKKGAIKKRALKKVSKIVKKDDKKSSQKEIMAFSKTFSDAADKYNQL